MTMRGRKEKRAQACDDYDATPRGDAWVGTCHLGLLTGPSVTCMSYLLLTYLQTKDTDDEAKPKLEREACGLFYVQGSLPGPDNRRSASLYLKIGRCERGRDKKSVQFSRELGTYRCHGRFDS